MSDFLPDQLASFRNASPMLRTVGMLFPVINDYLYFTQILGIARLHPDKQSQAAKAPMFWALSLSFMSILLCLLAFLPGALYFLFLLSVIPTAIAQHWLNAYWDSQEEKGLLTRHGFSLGELFGIVVGGLLIGFIGCSFLFNINK